MCASAEYTPLDETDRKILQRLQRDARNKIAVEIGEQIGVSDGTVRNRIRNSSNGESSKATFRPSTTRTLVITT
ncbi:AsnC family transcriptional regulator [Haloterrigena salina JCM 13891]|uniref:AsnC family transcriptional regulator n=1 Tax=Haloterrigena salina JCM 13891 TaxID=1227488 RepID=M0C952_9EURY|nr:AsnC family protein [Haloterrigena salina]ELZ18439.1 AsnC family transcriptional regulator [Haloterrigena salina JCM 13891]